MTTPSREEAPEWVFFAVSAIFSLYDLDGVETRNVLSIISATTSTEATETQRQRVIAAHPDARDISVTSLPFPPEALANREPSEGDVERLADRIEARMGPVFGSPEYLADPVKLARAEKRRRDSAVSFATMALDECRRNP